MRTIDVRLVVTPQANISHELMRLVNPGSDVIAARILENDGFGTLLPTGPGVRWVELDAEQQIALERAMNEGGE